MKKNMKFVYVYDFQSINFLSSHISTKCCIFSFYTLLMYMCMNLLSSTELLNLYISFASGQWTDIFQISEHWILNPFISSSHISSSSSFSNIPSVGLISRNNDSFSRRTWSTAINLHKISRVYFRSI